jgi:carboxypeptidase PM20D1
MVSDPIPEFPLDPELWKILTETALLIAPRAIVAPFLVNMATDSRHFRSVTESIVRLIPVVLAPEDLARIHGVDERISLENYGRIITFYTSIIRIAAGRKE